MILGFLGEITELSKYKGHIVSSSIEHPAVLETLKTLEKSGWEISYVDPEADGIISVDKILAEVKPETALVNLMYVNNETGAVQPVLELSLIHI